MKYYLIVFLLFIISVHISQKINKDFIHNNIFRNNGNSIDSLISDKIKKINNINKIEDCSLNCLECENSICKRCERGFYALKNICFPKCPEGFYADNYSLSCKLPEENPVFIKAYTFSRCTNKCEQRFSDCSCEKECKLNGTCCSDYKYCDFVYENIKNNNNQINNNITTLNKSCGIENCFSCIYNESIENKKENSSNLCLMCNEGFYYYKNKCLKACPENTTLIEANNICLEKNNCNVDNCDHCDITGTKCEKCSYGYFLNENTCSKTCPAGMRADRIKFDCVNKSSFAFNMIFPSKGSCYNKCGYQDKVLDCSCNIDCLKNGNCCDDFEKECQSELKKEKCKSCFDCQEGKCIKCLENSELHKGDCICKTGFHYDKNSDKCLLSLIKIKSTQKRKIKNKSYSNKPIKNTNDIRNDVNENNNDLDNDHSEGIISKLLKGIFKNLDIGNKENILNPTKSNIELKGNITLNIFEGNKNPNIINEKVINENSFNNSTTIEKNINSHNAYVGNKYKQGKLKNKNIKFNKSFGNKNNKSNLIVKMNNKITKKALNDSIDKDIDNEEIDTDEFIDFRKKLNSRLNKNKFLNIQLKNSKQHFRKTKININKHNHINHEKKFPEDFNNEEDEELNDHSEKLITNQNKNEEKINKNIKQQIEENKHSKEIDNKSHSENKNKINNNTKKNNDINNDNLNPNEKVIDKKEKKDQKEKINKNDSQNVSHNDSHNYFHNEDNFQKNKIHKNNHLKEEEDKLENIKKHLLQNHENNDFDHIIKNLDKNIKQKNSDINKKNYKQDEFDNHSFENSNKSEKAHNKNTKNGKNNIIKDNKNQGSINKSNNNQYTDDDDEEIQEKLFEIAKTKKEINSKNEKNNNVDSKDQYPYNIKNSDKVGKSYYDNENNYKNYSNNKNKHISVENQINEKEDKNENKYQFNDNMFDEIINKKNKYHSINEKKGKNKNNYSNSEEQIDIENYIKNIHQIENEHKFKKSENKKNQEKLNLNILIPNSNSNSNENSSTEKSIHNKITVFNHYFINDKSTNMNHPKNPNVFNIYGEEAKNLDFNKFSHPKFISDKAYKEFNNTKDNEYVKNDKSDYEYEEDNNEKEHLYVIDKTDSKNFSLPVSQKNEIKDSFLKNKFFKNKNPIHIESNYENNSNFDKDYSKKLKRINSNKYSYLDNSYNPERKFKKINFKVFRPREYNKKSI